MFKEYDLEPLIESITGIDWRMEHAKAIQETVLKNSGNHLSEVGCCESAGWLVERRFIRTQLEPVAEGGGNQRKLIALCTPVYPPSALV